MTRRMAALGIDGPHDGLMMAWIAAGLLPNLAALRAEGASGRFTHEKRYRNERCWESFTSGRPLEGCGAVFVPGRYDYFNESLQRDSHHLPFYALGDGREVCVFDLPAPLVPAVKGFQLSGWSSELNASTPQSLPAGLIDEVIARYGGDPKLDAAGGVLPVTDYRSGEAERSWRVPSIYDPDALVDFKERLLTAVRKRTEICLDLLARRHWDLFLAVFPEMHSANHVLWHWGGDHPLRDLAPPGNALLEIFQAIDAGLGRIAAALPDDMGLLVFTLDHNAQNTMDVPSLALLPEWLYRWNFPGRCALAAGEAGTPLPPRRTDYRQHWKHELWRLRTEFGECQLSSPQALEAEGSALSWNPAHWYSRLWPQMRAFALPGVSDGHIRLNVRGREASGLIEPAEFAPTLDQLERQLAALIDPRTGRPAVARLIRTRSDAFDAAAIAPDLMVSWHDAEPIDTLDCPRLGRIGPVPYFRTGGHVAHGTTVSNHFFVRAPGVAPGTVAPDGELVDLPVTLLGLLGAPVPPGLPGRSLLGGGS